MRRELLPQLPEWWLRAHAHRLSELERRAVGSAADLAAQAFNATAGGGFGDRAAYQVSGFGAPGGGSFRAWSPTLPGLIAGGSIAVDPVGGFEFLTDGVFAIHGFVEFTHSIDVLLSLDPTVNPDGFQQSERVTIPAAYGAGSVNITIGMQAGSAYRLSIGPDAGSDATLVYGVASCVRVA